MGKGKGRGPWKIWLSVGALAAFGICLALVSAGQRSRGKQFTAFFAMTGDSVPEDNRMIRRIAERTGVRVSVEWLNGQISSERIESMIRLATQTAWWRRVRWFRWTAIWTNTPT